MLMDPMGGIVMTNDGNAILREVSIKSVLVTRSCEILKSQLCFTCFAGKADQGDRVPHGTTELVLTQTADVRSCASVRLLASSQEG